MRLPSIEGDLTRPHKGVKSGAIRPQVPLSVNDARRNVSGFVEEYNERRLHSAIGYVTSRARLEGHQAIRAARDAKLEAARAERTRKRQQARAHAQVPVASTAQAASSWGGRHIWTTASSPGFHFTLDQYSHRTPPPRSCSRRMHQNTANQRNAVDRRS